MIQKINNGSPSATFLQKNQKPSDENFGNVLKGFLKDVNQLQGEAKESAEAFLRGDVTDLHEVTIASQKARLSLEMLLEIRNKMMESYQEIMRMQL